MTQTSARSNSPTQNNAAVGRADHTSTGVPKAAPQSKRSNDTPVDQTSARSMFDATSKGIPGRADPTSTAPNRSAQSKRITGAVDQTSARSTLAAKSNHVTDRADHTSTAPIPAPKSKRYCGAVDQLPTASTAFPPNNFQDGAVGPFLADPVLGILAYAVDDLEMVRIANENRLRALTSEHGLTLDHPDVARMAAIVNVSKDQEHQAVLGMNRIVRRHPLWGYMKPIAGVGEKQFARLLAVIGDPYWNDLYERPRTMRELRAYCGWHVVETSAKVGTDSKAAHGGNGHADNSGDDSKSVHVGVAPKRQRGQQSNWNDEARKRVWLIAESCMKQRNSIYRGVYDAARKQYEGTVHPNECVRCGPKGKPAQPGSPRSAGHQHAMALRKVAVAFLADLWREAKRLHEQPVAKGLIETQKDTRRQVTTSHSQENSEH